MAFKTDFTQENKPYIVRTGPQAPANRTAYIPPTYEPQTGSLVCRSCGQPVKRTVMPSGAEYSSCGNSQCRNVGQTFFEGDLINDPNKRRVY